jgi:hypothetical protein
MRLRHSENVTAGELLVAGIAHRRASGFVEIFTLNLQRILLSGRSIDGISRRENRGKVFTVRNTVKKSRMEARGQIYGVATTPFLQGLARVGDRS